VSKATRAEGAMSNAARAERLAERVGELGLELLLVSDLVNVRYLTGYSGSNGIALVGPRMLRFLTDFRYVEQAAAEVDPAFERLEAPRALLEGLPAALPEGELRLGFDSAHLSVAQHERLRELLGRRVELVAAPGLIERLRAVKEPGEVERIREAARLADDALRALLERGLAGRSERQLALELEWEMRARGARRASFEPIVAAGAHAALPHARPRERQPRRGELVLIDWGAELEGYCSDCTRTLALGPVGQRERELYELVARAQGAGLEALAAGVPAQQVDKAARAVIEVAGWGERFGHGLGHGVGLEIHEAPTLSPSSAEELSAGNVVTIEPGVYLPGSAGVRIEDLVLVTDSGREILSGFGKELLEVD
jgi:Xaa-Pro aminopeptidase